MSNDDYKVGYGKPPKNTRWKKGQSGNLKGAKKKKASTFESEVKDVLSSKVSVIIDGKPVLVSKRQLLIEQIVNLAIKGNSTMARIALPLLKVADNTPDFEVLPEDEAALKALMLNFDDGGSDD